VTEELGTQDVGGEPTNRDEAQAAMNAAIGKSIADSEMQHVNPAGFRVLQAEIRKHAATVAGYDNAAAEAKDAADMERILGDDAGLSVAECRARAEELLRTPGYVEQTPGAMTEEARANLTAKIHALHQVAEGAVDAIDAEEELRRLQALGIDGADDFDLTGIEPWEVRGLHMQRLHAEGDLSAVALLLDDAMSDLETTPESRALLAQFSAANVDRGLRERISQALIEWIYSQHA